MVTVNRTPLNTIPHEWAFDREIGPWIRELLEQLRQLRERTGGDADYITEVQGDLIEGESPLNYDIRGLERDRDKYRAEEQTKMLARSLRTENAAFRAELMTALRTVKSVSAEFAAMKAEHQTQTRKIHQLEAKLNALIAEVQTNA